MLQDDNIPMLLQLITLHSKSSFVITRAVTALAGLTETLREDSAEGAAQVHDADGVALVAPLTTGADNANLCVHSCKTLAHMAYFQTQLCAEVCAPWDAQGHGTHRTGSGWVVQDTGLHV